MLKVCGIGILVAVISFLLSELGFRGKRALVAFSIVLFFLIFIDLAKDVIKSISEIPINAQGGESLSSALKIIGIGHAFGIACDVCTELSEGGISSVLALIGKLEIAVLMIPFLKEIVELFTKLLS
jgi:hypothetical protein